MSDTSPRLRIAVLGAGPIGLEAALYARALGHRPVVFERGAVGENISRWHFVELFTPWKMNVSPLGLECLDAPLLDAIEPEAFPTGGELIEGYLGPIAAALNEADALQLGTEIVSVSRAGFLKGEDIGGKERRAAPFRLLLREGGREREELADVVLDTTGVYASPNRLGSGGGPAVGEADLADRIDYHLVDVNGAERSRLTGKTVLLLGAGFSAATSLQELARLHGEGGGLRVVWAYRSESRQPFPLYPGDPLPGRVALAEEGNRIANAPPSWCEVVPGAAVESISPEGSGLRVILREAGGSREHLVDRVFANVGYRPDTDLARELQFHQCYASEGPMALAAALLSGGSGGDCLTQSSTGPATLKTPEPGFFVLGHKSYGRRSDFLLRVGREQVRDAFRLLEDDPQLDLYARAARREVGTENAPGGRP